MCNICEDKYEARRYCLYCCTEIHDTAMCNECYKLFLLKEKTNESSSQSY